MPRDNLDLIRAKHALDFAKAVATGTAVATGKEGGDAMKKVPSMIMANGLLPAIAFAIEEKKGGKPRSPGHMAIFNAIAQHLASKEIGITPGVKDARSLIDHLVEKDSHTLKQATSEALAWLAYARRFVTPAGTDDHGEDIE